jgi:hypothetical protein
VNLRCEFRPNRLTTDHIFCFRQMVKNKMCQSGEIFNYFKNACDPVKRAVLFNISLSFYNHVTVGVTRNVIK